MLVADRSRSTGPFAKGWMPVRTASAFATALVAASALTGCFLGDGEPEDKPPVGGPLSACVDVSPAAKEKADALVAQGNREMAENMRHWTQQSDSWWEAKARSPEAAMARYDQALAAAPGHCQAIFGRAVASATMLTQDRRMDDFIRKVEAAEGGGNQGLAKQGSFAAVMRTPPDQAGPVLIKLAADLEKVDGPSVKEAQALIEEVILPKLDSTIAALEKVMDYELFAIRYDLDGDTLEIDRGEVGPGLAGLKVAKAWLTVVAGYNIDPAPDATWDWYRTLSDIDNEDFDRLTAAQTAALDHFTNLFKTSSPFTRMREGWKARINGIPQLLLSAVGDAQRGLESAIGEARRGDAQRYDVLRVGSGEDSDIDTADLRGAVILLERSKKYLTGEQEVEYDRGTRRFKVNLVRLFHVDGLQNFLPYFKFRPYSQWNDTVSADTSWGTYAGWEVQQEIITRSGYDSERMQNSIQEGYLGVRDSLEPGMDWPRKVVARTIVYSSYETDSSGFGMRMVTRVLAVVIPDADDPCAQSFSRRLMMTERPGAPGTFDFTPDLTAGTFRLKGCRVQGGAVEYVQWVDAQTVVPFLFTDPTGNTVTLDPLDIDDIDDPSELKGKIILRDPTFGGILPGQTNDSFWDHVSAIGKAPGSRVKRECGEVDHPGGWTEWKCTRTLPPNPSDLDYMDYYLDWWDNGF